MNKSRKILSFLSLTVVIFFSFYRLGLDSVTTDDTHFKNWSYVFMKEYEQKKYDRLYVSVQPGVLTIYTNILGFKSFYFLRDKLGFFQDITETQTDLFIHIFSKIPKSVLVLLCLIAASLLVKRVFGFRIGLLFFLLMGLEPFVLGNTRVIQTDILPAYLVFISTLIFYRIKEKGNYYYYALVGTLLGLSNIEKASTVVVLPIFLGFIMVRRESIKVKLLKMITLVSVFLLTMILLFPAFWGNLSFTFWRLFIGSFIQGVKGQDAETFTYATTAHVRQWYFYFRFLYNQLSEFTLVGLFSGFIFLVRNSLNKNYDKLSKYIFLVVVPLIFLLLFQLSTKKVERFMLYLFPFIILYASSGIVWVASRYKLFTIIIVTIITIRIVQFIFLFPDFLIYRNFLTLDRNYSTNYISWGVGFYKLSNFLETTYGFNKVIYIGDYQSLRLFYNGFVLDKEVLDINSYYDLVIKTNEQEDNKIILESSKLDGIYSPYKYVNFYIYKRL
ncbi:glycosyltransferase family 39 protein [Patescibacteria group bacterium]|nr:glycosyltransferase family 39 protein [Patescibacteria group bacterium]